jgi:hypothetical protein
MRAVLDLDPMFASAGAIGAVEALRNNAFQTHVARDAEENVADVEFLLGAFSYTALLMLMSSTGSESS